MAALIGALRVSLSADTAAFASGMKRAEAQAKTSASAINKSLGLVKAGFAGFVSGISIGAITQGIKASLDYAGSLGEVAQQLGVTTRELQTFRYAVSQNGGTVEQADQALGKFAISISKAQSGSKQAAEAFKAAGVSLNDLATKSKSEILGQIADRFKATGGASANAAAGVALFGRGFQKIIPTLDQGSAGMNELAAAADELGIVLSDEQIQKADQTADKLDALMTVLKARIAGDVADNADSILDFADALFDLVRAAEDARAALVRFQQNYNLPNLLGANRAFGNNVAGSSVTTDLNTGGSALAIARARGLKIAGEGSGGGGNPTRFLGGGRGGGGKRAPRDTSLRDAFQFEEEQRRLDIDILRAKQDLTHYHVERSALAIEILNKEKEGLDAELKFRVADKQLTEAQAEKLRLKNDEVDRLQRDAVLDADEEQRKREYNILDDKDYSLKLEKLELEADLAETAKARRSAELKILDLAHQEERNRLERIIRESKDWVEIEAARKELVELSKRQGLERQGVVQRTRGPMESAAAQYGDLTEEMENLKVQGIEATGQALATLATEGFGSFREMAISSIRAIIAEFIRLQTMKMLFSAIGSATSAATGAGTFGPSNPGVGFATGGFTGWGPRNKIAGFVHGQEGVLNTRGLATLGVPNLNALNRGAPMSAVSNDNSMTSGGDTYNISIPHGMSPYQGRATGRQIARGNHEAVAFSATGRRR